MSALPLSKWTTLAKGYSLSILKRVSAAAAPAAVGLDRASSELGLGPFKHHPQEAPGAAACRGMPQHWVFRSRGWGFSGMPQHWTSTLTVTP